VPGFEREPSPYEYWNNGVGADNSWTFLKGPTPSVGTGPNNSEADAGYAYCEVLPSKVGQTFSLVTPLIDLLDLQSDASPEMWFQYHMHGIHIGNLKVQASHDSTFQTGVKDLLVSWDYTGTSFAADVISAQQHINATDAFKDATADLSEYIQTRFYIRFLYTAGITHLSDCAIGLVQIWLQNGDPAGNRENSFKLFNPTFDNHHRPSAIYTRSEYAKRPMNIRNIHMTGTSPTKAGNFLNRYEYVNTTSPEANDPFFVKNTEQIAVTSSERVVMAKIEDILRQTPGTPRTGVDLLGNPALVPSTSGHSGSLYVDYKLPDRSYINSSNLTKNKTRIMTRFSTPGFEASSRGFLDPAHETYSAYNAMTFKNLSARTIYNTQLQSHCGQYGVSTHDTTTARVYGSEAPGTIQKADYQLAFGGNASKHKYHRNNIERLEISGSPSLTGSLAAALNGTNQYFLVADDVSLSFTNNPSVNQDKTFSISAWVKADDTSYFPIIEKYSHGSAYEWRLGTDGDGLITFYVYDNDTSNYEKVQDSQVDLPQAEWVHVVATADGAAESKAMKIYINGVLRAPVHVDDRTDAGTYVAMHNTSAPVYIGRQDAGTPKYADGAIDEVSLWGVELNAAEVLDLYYGGPYEKDVVWTPGPGDLSKHPQYSNLVSWWRLGDTGDSVSSEIISTSVDRKGSNNATGQNSPTTTTGPAPGRGDIVVTASSYDNAYVSHMIPRTDKQYAWITGSLI
jgi:hypothetical protein